MTEDAHWLAKGTPAKALLGQFHKTVEYNWREVHREMTIALRH